jgi:ATP-dependent DNA helicase RecG
MIRSPLILAVDEAMDFIKKNIRLGFGFGGETTKRSEKWQYPIPAIRELLLNAIVHRDYTNPTDVIIKIFDENIEITNPGKLMGDLTIEKLSSGNYISKHRNKLLTEAFYLTGDIEKYGTGFKRVNNWFKDYPNLEYKLYNLTDFIQVKIKDSLSEGINEGINKLYNYIRNKPDKRVSQIEKELNIPSKTLERWIKELKTKKKIIYKGSKKTGGYYVL